MEELPFGEQGLISFKGANVFAGYLNNPEATKAALHGEWLVTGDLGRLDSDGFLYVDGRLSRFSKIGGDDLGIGGSMTIEELGWADRLAARGKHFWHMTEKPEGILEMENAAPAYITSVNAASADGALVNIDGNGNRVCATSYGVGKKVFFVFGENKIDKFELAKVGQATEHNYCGVNCGIMDQFASVFGKKGSLIRLDCRSLEYQYFPFEPKGYRLVLVDSVVKHELASSAYNKRRQSCENVVAAIQKKHPHVEYLRDCTMDMLNEAKAEISEEDYKRAEYVIEEIQRVLDVCDALEKGDYETVGQKMYETHHGMSKLYEVSCEELDFLNDLAFDCGVTGSRVMGGGFGGCTINLVKEELYTTFVEKAKEEFKKKFGRSPKIYDVVISDGARRLE